MTNKRQEKKNGNGEKLSPLAALRKYMTEGKWGRKVDMEELKALSTDDRTEMGKMALVALAEGWD